MRPEPRPPVCKCLYKRLESLITVQVLKVLIITEIFKQTKLIRAMVHIKIQQELVSRALL